MYRFQFGVIKIRVFVFMHHSSLSSYTSNYFPSFCLQYNIIKNHLHILSFNVHSKFYILKLFVYRKYDVNKILKIKIITWKSNENITVKNIEHQQYLQIQT